MVRKIDAWRKNPMFFMGVNTGDHVVTDDEIDRFRDTTAVGFGIEKSSITDKGLVKWASFPNVSRIESLALSAPAVTDGGTYNLGAFTGLKTLMLRDMAVTDKTLERIGTKGSPYKSLKVLHLQNTKVTAEGVKRFKEARPDVVVYVSPNGSNSDADRKLAEWVLANKGWVMLRSNNVERHFASPATLPDSPFLVARIGPGEGSSNFTVTDADLEMLLAVKNLKSLEPKRSTFTDDGVKKLATASYANEISAIDLTSPNLTDAGIEHLKSFPNLFTLRLDGAQITDAGLKHLAGLKNLKSLNVKGTKVTLSGVKSLMVASPGLKVTMDYDPKADPDRPLAEWVIRGGGMVSFEDQNKIANNLKQIPEGPVVVTAASPNVIVDADVPRFRDVNHLTILGLPAKAEANQLTDKGLAELASYPFAANLTYLFLRSPKVTDAGVAHLAKFTSLAHADLTGVGLTDQGLKTLAGIKNLKSLSVVKTKVTAEGVMAFREALPDCKLSTDFDKK